MYSPVNPTSHNMMLDYLRSLPGLDSVMYTEDNNCRSIFFLFKY